MTKFYGPTMAVNDVDLSIVSGEVHALLGENGAGKSTLAKVAAGIISPTSGVVDVGGSVVNFTSVREAEELGIVLIPQELNLFGPLSITENLFAGRRRPRNRLGLIDTKRMRATATETLGSLGADFDIGKPAERLSAASRQLVAIARALVLDTRVLIMDEPTAALDDWEASRLLSVIDQLKQSGVGILYVSHRLSEIRQTADKVTILRDGNLVASGPVSDFDDGAIVRHMVGREVVKASRRDTHATEEIALRVTKLSRKGSFENVTFDLRRGEVVGLAGLIGAGRSELARAICGERPAESGMIEVDGEQVSSTSVADSLRHGVGYVPEERQSQGLLLPFTGVANISLPVLDRYVARGFVDQGQERRAVEETVNPLSIRGDIRSSVETLSGGNQQKVLLAKWLMADPNVLILDEPTRGVDVGVRADIYDIIDNLASEGRAILVISSDIDEIIAVSNRVLVMRGGRVVAEIDGADATQMSIGEAALGHVEGSRG